MADGVALIESLDVDDIRLLADLFHMNIEEADIARGVRDGGRHIGHVHFVDPNRRPAGCGHIDYAPVAAALKELGYNGYASAEALPWPDPESAARQTIDAYRRGDLHARRRTVRACFESRFRPSGRNTGVRLSSPSTMTITSAGPAGALIGSRSVTGSGPTGCNEMTRSASSMRSSTSAE